jgi:hypothetical protein
MTAVNLRQFLAGFSYAWGIVLGLAHLWLIREVTGLSSMYAIFGATVVGIILGGLAQASLRFAATAATTAARIVVDLVRLAFQVAAVIAIAVGLLLAARWFLHLW